MAKDGTLRGNRKGNYTGAGRKPKPLTDKIAEGDAIGTKVMEIPEFQPTACYEPADYDNVTTLEGNEMPTPSDYLSDIQCTGDKLTADSLYKETWEWLRDRGCEKLVNPRLLESYALSFTRYIQCERMISEKGFLGKHPTTGSATASPFVQMSQSYLKQSNLLWYEIFDIVKQNCSKPFEGNPNENAMAKLLGIKSG